MPKGTSARTHSRSHGRAPASTTLTKVRTNTITNSKIMVATLALFLANGLALIGVPAASSGRMQLAAGPKCGVNRIVYGKSCGSNRYTGARVTCYDQTFRDVGVGVCSTSAAIQALAVQSCQNRCAVAPSPVQRPLLSVRTNMDTPLATNLLLGSVDNQIAKFDLTPSALEDINLRDFVVSFHLPPMHMASGTLRNIRLYDGNVQVAGSIQMLDGSVATGTFASAVFQNVNLRLVRGQVKTLTVKADLTDYENLGASGVRFQPVILASDYDANMPGVQLSIRAVGMNSGTALESRDISFVSSRGTVPVGSIADRLSGESFLPVALGNVEANQYVAYRSKVSVAWAGDTPSGVAAPSGSQVIAKLIIGNISNAGNYNATVRTINFDLNSTVVNVAPRTLTVYRDSLNTRAVATTQLVPTESNHGLSFTTNSGFQDASFSDIDISSGMNKVFIATLDTTESRAMQTLSVSIPSVPRDALVSGVIWSDGVVNDIISHDNLLPLSYKTFVY